MQDKSVGIFVVVLIVGALAALMFFGGNGDDRRLDKTQIGVYGLGTWLSGNDVALRRANERRSPAREDLGLRILPIYDTDLDRSADRPETREDVIRQTTQRDMSKWVFEEKLYQLPTLVALPKWTSGFTATKIAHDQTLIPTLDMQRLFGQTPLKSTRLVRLDEPLLQGAEVTGDFSGTITLFKPQLFDRETLPDQCSELAGLRQGALLVECDAITPEGEDTPAPFASYFLSDPDAVNNHGLALGDNPEFAVALVRYLNAAYDDRTVYLDPLSTLNTTTNLYRDEREDYDQGWEEFARYFAYPFSAFWAVGVMLLAVAYWRGAIRFGPLIRPLQTWPEQSKTAAIEAKARLLRLSGNDGHMAADFTRAKLQSLAVKLFGPDLGQAGQKRLFDHLARRDADLADDLETTSDALVRRGPDMGPNELGHHLRHFKTLCEKVI